MTHMMTGADTRKQKTLGAVGVLSVLSVIGLGNLSALADDLIVRVDQSQLLRLPRPVSEVIIGNPGIADVTVQGGSLLVVTGKSFGVTNIIALDSERNIIQDQKVMVARDEHGVVNLHRGGARQTYSCNPVCGPMLSIGDDVDFFKAIVNQNTSKIKSAEGSAESEKGGQ